MRELALFAGAGGGILGGVLLGWRTVVAVEIDPYCRSVLLARQRDGLLPRFPIWDDIRTFDGKPWSGSIDVVSGGFPCQDISSAGPRTGLAGARSGLWREFARIIGEVEPAFVFIENSPYLRTRGLVTVLKNLASLGYDARWGVLGADYVGAPHKRRRMWIVANSDNGRQRELALNAQVGRASATGGSDGQKPPDTDSASLRQQPRRLAGSNRKDQTFTGVADWWPVDLLSGVDDGMADSLDIP